MGWFKRVQSTSPKLPTLRFRGKIVLGFAAVLMISAASLGIAWRSPQGAIHVVEVHVHTARELPIQPQCIEPVPLLRRNRGVALFEPERHVAAHMPAQGEMRELMTQSGGWAVRRFVG